MPQLLRSALPSFAEELHRLLVAAGHPDLFNQVDELQIVDRCRCGDDFCATFYTQPKPTGSYGSRHRCIELEPEAGVIILDVVNEAIACVEVLYRDDVRDILMARIP